MNLEQAVIVNFNYGLPDLSSLFELEDELEQVIEDNDLGVYDGNEIAVDLSDGALFMYGPDAQKLFNAIQPVLKQSSFMKDATVKIRIGDVGAPETIVKL